LLPPSPGASPTFRADASPLSPESAVSLPQAVSNAIASTKQKRSRMIENLGGERNKNSVNARPQPIDHEMRRRAAARRRLLRDAEVAYEMGVRCPSRSRLIHTLRARGGGGFTALK
jgi:hypothetical protein